MHGLLKEDSGCPSTNLRRVVAFLRVPLSSLMGWGTSNQPRSFKYSPCKTPSPRTRATWVLIESGEAIALMSWEVSPLVLAWLSVSLLSSLLLPSSAYVNSSAPEAHRSKRWTKLTFRIGGFLLLSSSSLSPSCARFKCRVSISCIASSRTLCNMGIFSSSSLFVLARNPAHLLFMITDYDTAGGLRAAM